MLKILKLKNFGLNYRLNCRKLSSKHEMNELYTIHKIDLQICGQLYEQLKTHNKLYRNSPNDGLKVNIEYADTYSSFRNNLKPVVVALHGVPGSHKDFTHLIKYFDSKNYRVIVANFPGFELTQKTQSYWHSAQEKAQLVRDLLTALNVKEVDSLICHSGGLFPGSFLWSESEKLKVKSVALFNTPSTTWIGKWRIILTNFFAKMISQKIVGFISFNPSYFAKLLGYPTAGHKNQLFEGALMSANSGYSTLHNRFMYLTQNRIPTLFLMSENDKILEKQYFFDAIDLLNGDKYKKYNYDIFDGNKSDVKLVYNYVNRCNSLQVINIRPAGHYAFIKFSDIVNPYIENLIKTIR